MLQFSDAQLRRGPRILLDAINLTIHRGEKFALVGENGSGKSSLFAVITGSLSLDAGSFTMPAGLEIVHLEQQEASGPESVLDWTLAGDRQLTRLQTALARAEADGDGERLATLHQQLLDADAWSAPARAATILAGLGFAADDIERPVDTFSGGWRMRMNIARALMAPSELLLLDEPTNHLDLDAIVWLESWLQRYPGTLLVISHDRAFLDRVAGGILAIEHQRITRYSGNYSDYERQRAEALRQQEAQYRHQQRQAEHLTRFVERFRAKATKAKQAQSRIKALERLELAAPLVSAQAIDFRFPEPERSPSPLIRLDGVSAGYGETPIVGDINWTVLPGERIGLLGANGAGKTTVMRLLSGDLAPMTGEIVRGKGLEIGYFAQHQLETLQLDSTPLQHMRQTLGMSEQAARNFLGGFRFSDDRATQLVGEFSGGERSRLALAMIVARRPNLLLLDEPTNHLDMAMRDALSMALNNYAGSVILVSHDRQLLEACCEQFLVVRREPGAVSRLSEWGEDMEAYRRALLGDKSSHRAEPDKKSGPPANAAATVVKSTKPDEASRAERKRLQNQQKTLESRIERLRRKHGEVQEKLGLAENYEDMERLHPLLRENGELEEAIEQAETQWLEAQEKLDALAAE